MTRRTPLATFASLATLAFGLLFGGCAHVPPQPTIASEKGSLCAEMVKEIPYQYPLKTLDLVTSLWELRCHNEAIQLGQWARSAYRDKSYSVSTEVVSVFAPEEATSEYVLESYERVYLSFLVASSYAALGKLDQAKVELRKSYSEGKAILYNYGDDPVNTLLVAMFWDNLGEADLARPFWQMLSERGDDATRSFASRRVSEIDRGVTRWGNWNAHFVGRMPALDWKMNFTRSDSGYYKVLSKSMGVGTCTSSSGTRISTTVWEQKIGARYASDYHPLLNLKSWVRLPIGLTYGLVTAGLGTGVLVGGCLLDASAKADGELCKLAVYGGGELIDRSTDVVDYALKPDLRHWRQVPEAIVVTSQDDPAQEPCFNTLPSEMKSLRFELPRQSVAPK